MGPTTTIVEVYLGYVPPGDPMTFATMCVCDVSFCWPYFKAQGGHFSANTAKLTIVQQTCNQWDV